MQGLDLDAQGHGHVEAVRLAGVDAEVVALDGRECALGREFLPDKDGTDLSCWLYNDAAEDRQQAIVELLDVRPETAAALFEASGWQPACMPVTPRTATSPAPRRSDAANPAE